MKTRINCLVVILMSLAFFSCTGSSPHINNLKEAKIKILLGKTEQDGRASDFPELCILDLDSLRIFELDKKIPRNPWDEAKFSPDGYNILINMRDYLGTSGLRRFNYILRKDEEFALKDTRIPFSENAVATLQYLNDTVVGYCVQSKFYVYNFISKEQKLLFDLHPGSFLKYIGALNFNNNANYIYFRCDAGENNEIKFVGRYNYSNNIMDTIRITDENLCDITKDGKYVMSAGYNIILSEIIGDTARTVGGLKNLPETKYSSKFLDNERIVITQLNRHKKERPCTFIVYNFKKDIVEQQFSIDDYYYFICDVYNANY